MTGSPPRHITVLGSTGSIGRNALDVVRRTPGAYVVDALAANANVDLLAAQIREFSPRAVAVHDRGAAAKLREMMPGLDVLEGQKGPARNIVLMNAGAALYAANVVSDMAEGVAKARETIDSGAAKAKLEQFIQFNRKAV